MSKENIIDTILDEVQTEEAGDAEYQKRRDEIRRKADEFEMLLPNDEQKEAFRDLLNQIDDHYAITEVKAIGIAYHYDDA